MQCQLEHQVVEAGRNKKLGENSKLMHWCETWVDEMNDPLLKRNITLKREENETIGKCNNKTLIHHAID